MFVVTTLQKISNVITKIMKVLMIIFFAYMVLSLGVEVISRYIFKHSFIWANESARYIMIWMIFVGAAEIMFNDEHIKVTVIEDLLKGKARKVLNIVQDVVGLIMSVLMVSYSFSQVRLASKAVSSNMGINMGIVYGIFPVVTILMAVAYVFRIIIKLVPAKDNAVEEGGDNA